MKMFCDLRSQMQHNEETFECKDFSKNTADVVEDDFSQKPRRLVFAGEKVS